MAVLPAMAQDAPQRIEITGSAIKRVNAEGPAPVEVVTRKDIARTGATSVNELIRSIPSIDVFDQGELASNSPSGSGTTNLAMRGLSSSNLLVLLNGRRLPVNALYDASGAGAAFDVNTIPVSAIERIEILKDGGSAIYGADAVAGVINIITKTDYQGIEARAGYGQSSRSDGTEKQGGITAGFGDLSKDRFNVLAGIDVFKRDPIYRKDRDISRSVNFTRFGSLDGRSTFSPYGNILDPNNGYDLAPAQYRPCPASDLDANGICRYDFNSSILTAYNGADRVSGLLQGNFQLTPDIRLFAEITASRTKDHFESHPVPDYFLVPIIDPSQQQYEEPSAPGNIYIAGRFMQGGPRITDRKATLLNTVVGAEGSSFGLDWKANLGRGVSKVTNTDSNYFDKNKWVVATTDGSLDPTVSTNDPAVVDALKVRPVREGKSVIEYVNAQVSGEAFKLPGGPVGWAAGVNYTRESLDDTPDPLTQAGQVVGSIKQSAVSARRNEYAVFGELRLPIVKSLEGQVAVRYDHYPTYNQTSPKVALKYDVSQQFALRGSYTESFRAPVLKQLFGGAEQGAGTVTDPDECRIIAGPTSVKIVDGKETCSVSIFNVGGSNANLKPEKGKTWDIGAVVDLGAFNATIDWWRIKKTDDIAAPSIDSAIGQGKWALVGPRIEVYTQLQNFAERLNEGVDLDARMRFPGTALGTITLQDSATYYSKQRSRTDPTGPMVEYNGSYALPRYRNRFAVLMEKGPWAGAVAVRSVGGFYDDDDPTSIDSSTRRVGAHDEVDLQASYSGVNNLVLTAGIKNVFDKMPPFSAKNGTDNTYTQMGFAELYTNRGRFFYVSATYTFR